MPINSKIRLKDINGVIRGQIVIEKPINFKEISYNHNLSEKEKIEKIKEKIKDFFIDKLNP